MENYEQKYNKALEIAKDYHDKGGAPLILEVIFPELKDKESKDEQIRKAIHMYLDWLDGRKGCQPVGIYSIRDMIAWLEKQGKQEQDPCEHCRDKGLYCHKFPCIEKRLFDQDKSASETVKKEKAASKFKVGEWITNGDYNWKIVEVKPLDYILQSQDGNIVDDTISYTDKTFHIWSIQDAKNGDVLANDSCIFIIQKIDDNNTAAKTYCVLYDDGDFTDGSILYFDIDSTKPATKEQRDLLFSKLKEDGWEWDSEKKELKKIEVNTLNADKVIEWLKPYGCVVDYIVEQFKKDFGL